jgi:hypothetical protein
MKTAQGQKQKEIEIDRAWVKPSGWVPKGKKIILGFSMLWPHSSLISLRIKLLLNNSLFQHGKR